MFNNKIKLLYILQGNFNIKENKKTDTMYYITY